MSQAGSRRFNEAVTLTISGGQVQPDARLSDVFLINATEAVTVLAPLNPINYGIIEIIFRAFSANRQMTLTTGSTGAFAFSNSGITALNVTLSGTSDYTVYQYNALSQRYHILGYEQDYS
jgi:hypothetical protein